MITVKSGTRSEEVLQGGEHTLFVEGSKNSLDPTVLDILLERTIRIKPLGPSYHVSSVAKALYPHHPNYYFLIDRDHYKDNHVEACWANFPDPTKHNLLIWRRREIENYFLDPEYLIQSKYCQVSQEELTRQLLKFAQARLFLDVANQVVVSIREEQKRNWIEKFSDVNDFSSVDRALETLNQANEFKQRKKDVGDKLSPEKITALFHYYLDKMTGGLEQLALGTGDWLSMIQGKKILEQLIHSACFRVEEASGQLSTGRAKLHDVVKDLLKRDSHVQPKDFIELKRLINNRVSTFQ